MSKEFWFGLLSRSVVYGLTGAVDNLTPAEKKALREIIKDW
jgi:hypothetical protein